MKENSIKAGELRLGNWVEIPRGACRVTGIDDDYISMGGGLGDDRLLYTTEEIKPIPLSKEVLEKCGFEKHLIDKSFPEEGYYYSMSLSEDKYIDLGFITGDKNGYLEACLFPYEEAFRCRYIHQLQNLYFALTGHELEITL